VLTSPPRQLQELKASTTRVPTSPPRQSQELEANTAKEPPSPPPQSQELEVAKESFESEFYVAGQKVEATQKEAIRGIWKALEPFSTMKEVDLGKSQYIKELQPQHTTSKDAEGDEPSIDILTVVRKFVGVLEKYQHKEPLEDLSTPGMTVEEFWQDGDKYYIQNLSMESCLFQNKSM
jgi:hypothetical protein